MNWSNVTTGFITSFIAHFILPNLTVIPKLHEYSVVDYRWSSLRVLLLQLYFLLHTLIKTIIICQTQPFTACSLIQHSSVFCTGHVIPADPLIWEKDQETRCCPFSKCPTEKNKKALQYHSVFIRWCCQWTSDGLKPYPSTPIWTNANLYRTTCPYGTAASSTTWGLTTWRPF